MSRKSIARRASNNRAFAFTPDKKAAQPQTAEDRLQKLIKREELLRLQAIAILGYDPREQEQEPPRFPISERDRRSHRYLVIQLLRERDGPCCYLCNTELDIEQSCIEHIIPISEGGPNEPHNIAIACGNCNTRKAGLIVNFNITSGKPVYHQPRTEAGIRYH